MKTLLKLLDDSWAFLLLVLVFMPGISLAITFEDSNEQYQGQGQGQAQGQAQAQGQLQGQLQGQSSYNGNYNKNLNGAYSDGSASSSDNSVTFNEAADRTIEYDGTYRVKNTPNIHAPALATSNGTCMGSSSVGGSGPGMGISIGSTWSDDSCTHRYNAQLMHNMGYKEVAVQIMCREESVAESAPVLCAKATQLPSLSRASKRPDNNGFFVVR